MSSANFFYLLIALAVGFLAGITYSNAIRRCPGCKSSNTCDMPKRAAYLKTLNARAITERICGKCLGRWTRPSGYDVHYTEFRWQKEAYDYRQ